ncbi:MAG TPA: histidinol dehydrogenase [Longimicrobiales bacterium]|nr:histidinol dehydrogenase [Longimicrobiales bacterium]
MTYCVPVGTELQTLTGEQRRALFDRGRANDAKIAATVAQLIADVRTRGDAALREQAEQFDGVSNLQIEVPQEDWQTAVQRMNAKVREALEQAAHNIAKFHEAQLPTNLEMEVQPGVTLGRRPDALARVAVYAPGGRAAYPSSVLMGVVPARVAGVKEVIVCSPAGLDGKPPETVLAACAIGHADRLFAIGGAGAIAAVAFGTETIPRADKVVGPGNAYVTEAKQQVNGVIAIDSPAGPSEVLVLADETANAELVAFELLAQAEHDPDAAAVVLSTSSELLRAVADVIERAIAAQPRNAIITTSLAARGALLLAASQSEMIEFNNAYAPEHLAIYCQNPRAVLAQIRNAGTVFLGESASVAFGDYMTGANHVLPTAMLARSYSGLSTLDFIRWTTYQEISMDAAAALSAPTGILADAEGLPAHAQAARLRARP